MSDELRATSHDYEWHPKYYGIVVGFFCGIYIITNTLNSKLVDFGYFVLPAGIITFPICCIITDILTEIYGFNRTRQAIWTVLACALLLAFFSELAIALPPASFWPHQSAFESVFSNAPRIAVAGCLAWLAGEFINSYILSKMKVLQNAKNPSLRFIGSTIAGQFADTLVYMSVAFAGALPPWEFAKMLLVAWLFKVFYEAIALPISVTVMKRLKHLEGIEHFDRQKLSLV